MLIALLPLHQQGTNQSAFLAGKALYASLPVGPRSWNPSADPVKVAFPSSTCLDPKIDPQERMPSILHNSLKEPASIESAISQDQDLPVSRNTALQVLQQLFPIRTPRSLGMRSDHFPGDWNGTASNH